MNLISAMLLGTGCGVILLGITQAYAAGMTIARSRRQARQLNLTAWALAVAGGVLIYISGII